MSVKDCAEELGADLYGVGNLDLLRKHSTSPSDLLEEYKRGISIAIKLTDPVIEGLPKFRELYAHQYREANKLLDLISFKLSGFIEDQGFKALPLPASQVLEDENWSSYMSHKSIARAAGLGWIGKSLLLVNEEYGPRIRLGSVLTNMPLEYDQPVENMCNDCVKCIESCPVSALRHGNFDDYPTNRSPYFDVDKCAEELKELANNPNIGNMVCGICIKACPWGGE